jgi:putative flippase GtrA
MRRHSIGWLASIVLSKTTLRQLLVFGAIGAIATLTHYLTALLVFEAIGVNLYVANLVGYGCALGVSYVGHGMFTFRVVLRGDVFRRFVVVSVATFLGSEALLAVLQSGFGLAPRVALAAVVLAIPAVTFVLHKCWVYRELPASPAAGSSTFPGQP